MNDALVRLEALLFPAVADLKVLSVDVHSEAIRVGVRSTAVGASCPGCGVRSRRVHASYLRSPTDMPSAGRRMLLRLHVRRFVCAGTSCERRTFAEQVPGLTRRYSRWTERLRIALAGIGLALAGRAGARLADVLGVSISRSAVLRLIHALPEPQPPSPRVVGVDEYAMRKGRVYGTVLIDIEARRPVDMLPDREAATVAAWLAKHSGIEVVCRDRAPFFAEGARTGAPQAVQVADRWHLWHNVSEAAERCVTRHRACLRTVRPAAGSQPEQETSNTDQNPKPHWPTSHRFADRTRTTHATVHAYLAAGHSRRAIARQLGMTYQTVKRYADAKTPEELFQGQWQGRPSKLDEFKPYLDERWSDGCTNAWTLWEEITARAAAATRPCGPTSAPSGPRPSPSSRGRHHREPSPDGSCDTPTTSPKPTISSSRPSRPSAPNSTPSPITSGPSPRCSPGVRASGDHSGSKRFAATISPVSMLLPPDSNATWTP
ncbi:hypothetical protein GCM10025734_83230 [Kitasatospora paranensis]